MSHQPLRVHLVAHHRLSRAGGVSGATRALGDALEARGCVVTYYSFDEAYGPADGREVPRMIRFPWLVARHLARVSRDLDVIDASTGDAWVWSQRGRPGTTTAALVTRAHGLEHVTAADKRARARRGEMTLSWKYPLYHGGYRLAEVRRSLTGADAQVFLNDTDREWAVSRLGVPLGSTAVVPNGVPDALLDSPPRIIPPTPGEPLALAFIGSWVALKGIAALVDMTRELHGRGVAFSLRLLGTGAKASVVLADFPEEVRRAITVTPRYDPAHIAGLLEGAHVLVQSSWTEGFSLGLAEGMACGLAPVATRSGGAATLIRDGESGLLVSEATGAGMASAVIRAVADSDALHDMRVAAQAAVRPLRWSAIADRTLDVYRDALARRAAANGVG